ncbi:MAG: ribonuclease HI family protein, partial [Patescibacteria group bacterium]
MQATLYTDGGARGNPGPGGIGYILSFEDGREVSKGTYIGEATNNQAEYKALRAGMARARAEGVSQLLCRLDSELAVKQLSGEYRVKDPDLKPLFDEVKSIASGF